MIFSHGSNFIFRGYALNLFFFCKIYNCLVNRYLFHHHFLLQKKKSPWAQGFRSLILNISLTLIKPGLTELMKVEFGLLVNLKQRPLGQKKTIQLKTKMFLFDNQTNYALSSICDYSMLKHSSNLFCKYYNYSYCCFLY